MNAAVGIHAVSINLVSSDRELKKLLHEVLGEIPEPPWSLNTTTVEEADPDSDLCLWDYESGMSLPGHIFSRPLRHLFLVHRKHLADFQAAVAPAEANILLKP